MRTKIHPDPRQGLSSRQVEQKKEPGVAKYGARKYNQNNKADFAGSYLYPV